MSTEQKSRATTFAILSSSLLHSGLIVAVLSMQVQIPRAEVIEIQIQEESSPVVSTIPVETILPEEAQGPEIAPETRQETAKEPTVPAKAVATTLPAKIASPASSLAAQQSFAETAVAVAPHPQAEAHELADSDELAENDESEALAQAAEAAALEADAFIEESDVIAERAKLDEQDRAQSAAKMAALRQAQSKAEFERVQEARKKSQEEAKQAATLAAAAEQKQKALAHQKQIHEAEVRYQAAQAAAAQAAAEARAADQAAAAAADQAAAHKAEENQRAAAALAKQGDLQGSKGGGVSTAQASSVRPLEDLKQMPGNEKPQYDPDDRLSGRNGVVVFYAFITSGGQPADFKLIQSSGHRSLDLKTLKAIRTWKFYPGQEGWVEIPFQWDLKGEPKAIGGTLRKVSQK
ncbi:MAG: TonB family protein [Bdellovibrio sp.]|jgi:TolA protein